MWRATVLLNDGTMLSQNCESKDKCEEFVLTVLDKSEAKRSVIVNQEKPTERYTENF